MADGPSLYPLCGKRDGDHACDRPAGHRGGCSGRLLELERLEREYHWAIGELQRTRVLLRDASIRATAAERELRQLARTRVRFLRRLFHH